MNTYIIYHIGIVCYIAFKKIFSIFRYIFRYRGLIVFKKLDIDQKRHLSNSSLFEGLTEAELEEALEFLGADVRRIRKRGIIVEQGQAVKMGFILSGEASLNYLDSIANLIISDRLSPGNLYGHTVLSRDYNVMHSEELTALTDVVVIEFDPERCLVVERHKPIKRFHGHLMSNLISIIAEHAVQLHTRFRIISQSKIRDRIETYLSQLARDRNGWIHIPFSMSELAVFLNTDRSALYKEIRKLRNDGELEWIGRKVRVLSDSFAIVS